MNDASHNRDETPRVQNLYTQPDACTDGEVFDMLLEGKGFRLVRIVSNGQSTPEGEWYDQEEAEWVLLLSGHAQLLFEGSEDLCSLRPGDYMNIPAHCRHRVERTASGEVTTWVVLHYSGAGE